VQGVLQAREFSARVAVIFEPVGQDEPAVEFRRPGDDPRKEVGF
jgi:hypothetical protein